MCHFWGVTHISDLRDDATHLLLKRTSLIIQLDLVGRWVKENETLFAASLFPTSFVRTRAFIGFIVLGANVSFALLYRTRLLQCHLS